MIYKFFLILFCTFTASASFAQIMNRPVVPLTEEMSTCEIIWKGTWVSLMCGGQPVVSNARGTQLRNYALELEKQSSGGQNAEQGEDFIAFSFLRRVMHESGYSEECLRLSDNRIAFLYKRSSTAR